MKDNDKRIGFTTSIPVEVIFAAGFIPLDLNNIFINHLQKEKLVEFAEEAGFPRNTCSWIKGIYSTALKLKMKRVIGVTQGDCSNTHALMETWQLRGIEVIPFSYPYGRDEKQLKYEISKLIEYFGTTWAEVKKVKQRLDKIRSLLIRLDELTWKEGRISGFINHLYLVASSDFNGSFEQFEEKLTRFLDIAKKSPKINAGMSLPRIAYIGVPPIFSDFYLFLEGLGVHVVYNEIQRQFSMPYLKQDITEQYSSFSYPYGAFFRLKDIKKELKRRKIDGVIHYTQSFCFRQIEDLIFRHEIDMPFLSIEGDRPGNLDARTKLRIESFVEMLYERKQKRS
ncbi:MAG: 2-hydroxyacyl-CoA dehydratase family protein [bacterium]|nr:2-hydroxyacyl-CoA dehydratase family protein [bacterium]